MNATIQYVRCQVACWFRKTFKDEAGAAEVVATLVIIGIALALALIFRDKLIELVKELWNKLVATGKESTNEDPTFSQWE
ncbi:MAG: hypothetical protein IK085_06840 [Clostridia bacterium]|nr:hypothetical protein [Clostridia bacterium]